jgi:thymidylate synthase (FAD)
MEAEAESGKFVLEPEVYVVGSQSVATSAVRDFLRVRGMADWADMIWSEGQASADVLCEIAGRCCYMSFGRNGRTHRAYLSHIKESGHGSVLEHAVISFIIAGVSRSLTHELVRHRAGWSYSQLSQRFVDESSARFVAPPAYIDQPNLLSRWKLAVTSALRLYRLLRDDHSSIQNEPQRVTSTSKRKIKNGASRSVLPNATETIIFCTVNGRALRHFLERRANPDADDEIRRLAMAMYYQAINVMPEILGDYVVRTCERGLKYLHTDHEKV